MVGCELVDWFGWENCWDMLGDYESMWFVGGFFPHGRLVASNETSDLPHCLVSRCLNLQRSPEVRLLGVPNTYSPGIWRIWNV